MNDVCYFQFKYDNSTINDTDNYNMTIKFVLSIYGGVTVSIMNGTTLESASNLQVVDSVFDEFEFDAANGNTVYFHVEGIQTDTYFAVWAFSNVVRTTPWPDAEARVIIETTYVQENITVPEEPLKPRDPQYSLDVITAVIVFYVLVFLCI